MVFFLCTRAGGGKIYKSILCWGGSCKSEFLKGWLEELLGKFTAMQESGDCFLFQETVNEDCISGPLSLCLIKRQQVRPSNSGALITAN